MCVSVHACYEFFGSTYLLDFDFADLSGVDGCSAGDGAHAIHFAFLLIFVSSAETAGQDLRVEAEDEVGEDLAAFEVGGEDERNADSADEERHDASVVRLRRQIAVTHRRHQRHRVTQTVIQRPIIAFHVAISRVVSVRLDTESANS